MRMYLSLWSEWQRCSGRRYAIIYVERFTGKLKMKLKKHARLVGQSTIQSSGFGCLTDCFYRMGFSWRKSGAGTCMIFDSKATTYNIQGTRNLWVLILASYPVDREALENCISLLYRSICVHILKMSFGFGVGDFVTVGQLCWKVYKKCKDSPGNYADLSTEVGNLHNVIKETDELLSQQQLTADEKAKVITCRQGCQDVLEDLNRLLIKYENLGTKAQRAFDRAGFGMQDMVGIRLRLISNVSILDAFNNT